MKPLSFSMCIALCFLSGCLKTPKQYSTHGLSIVTINSKWENECSSLGTDVHHKMANWTANQKESNHDSTFKVKCKSWKTMNLNNASEDEGFISSVEFIDVNANKNLIETICIRDEEFILIKCTSADDEATVKLRNAVVNVLNSKGFKPKK